MELLEVLLELIGLVLNLLLGRQEPSRTPPSSRLSELRPWAPAPVPGKQACKSCLWRGGDTCTAPDSPASGQSCEPVCSGRVACQAKLELGTDAAPFSGQPLAGERPVREGLLACPSCGGENPPDSIFCQSCGAAVLPA